MIRWLDHESGSSGLNDAGSSFEISFINPVFCVREMLSHGSNLLMPRFTSLAGAKAFCVRYAAGEQNNGSPNRP